MIWSDQYLLQLSEDGEIDASDAIHCLWYRFALETTSGTAIYTLPAGIIGINRVTWRGHKVHAMNTTEFMNDYGYRPTSSPSSSRPQYYTLLGYGNRTIRFYPTPNESLVPTGSEDVYGADIASYLIISAYRIADPPNGVRIPTYYLRRMIRYYVQMRAYLKEGKGQNLKAHEYFKARYQAALADFKSIVSNVPKAVIHQTSDAGVQRYVRPARPQLPPEYGS